MKRPSTSSMEEENPLLFSPSAKKRVTAKVSPTDEIDRIIDYSKTSNHQTYRRRVGNLFEDPTIDFILTSVNSIFTLILILQYIISNYNPDPFRAVWWGALSYFMHIYLFVEFLLRFYGTKDRRKYILSLESIYDVLSNVPFIIIRSALNPSKDDPTVLLLQLGDLFSLLRIMRLRSYQRFIVSDNINHFNKVIGK